MSGGLRLSLVVPGAATDALIDLAPRAEHWNLAALWLGDPRGSAANRADSYVTTAAGALGAITRDIRIGLFLALGEEQLVRIAEDVGVGDQACGGRLELGFVAPDESIGPWAERVARLLGAFHAWQLPGREETVAVIPGPAQPVVPSLVLADEPLAERLGIGRMVLDGEGESAPVPSGDGRLVGRRTILIVDPDAPAGGLVDWVGQPSAYERVLELRERASAAGAAEILLSLPAVPSELELTALGTVLVPALRASVRDVRAISTDAWTWITAKAHLHAPPAPAPPATPARS